jgi:hypothetical protein
MIKTMIHELTHVSLHQESATSLPGVAEVEAACSISSLSRTELGPRSSSFKTPSGPTGGRHGQRGMLMWIRIGFDSVNQNPFRLLNVAATA